MCGLSILQYVWGFHAIKFKADRWGGGQFFGTPMQGLPTLNVGEALPTFRGLPLPTQTPSLIARGQMDSCCCCCFLSLGTTLMLQSQSSAREDGVSLSWSRGSRWDYTALYPLIETGAVFSYMYRVKRIHILACNHGSSLLQLHRLKYQLSYK